MVFELKGVNAAFTTPFKEDESIDEEALRKDIQYLVEAGVHGLAACSTPGEMVLMSEEERKRVIEITVEESKGVPVIAECGSTRTKDAIVLAKFAGDVGASAAMVLTPWFFPQHPRGIRMHYEGIADSVDMPIIIHNLPKYTGVKLEPSLIDSLAFHSNICGFLDASGDLVYFQELMELAGDRMNFLCGADELIYPALCLGATGCIAAMAACLPQMVLDLYNSFLKKDLDRCKEIQLNLVRLKNELRKVPYPFGQKLVQTIMGRPSGRTRMPLGPLTGVERILLRKGMKKAGLI
jgi:4-hydroxy-tetrahydrodipicolinate synthase